MTFKINEPSERRSFYFRSKPPSAANRIDCKEVDKLLAQELNNLSFQERDSLFQELHGVTVQDKIKNETPEFIQQSLQQISEELARKECAIGETSSRTSSSGSIRAYITAKEKSPYYIESLKLPFLRAENYNIQEAASRLMSYLGALEALFSKNVLGRKVTIQDFHDDPESIRALESGFVQLLPCRDRAGRPVIFVRPKERPTKNMRYIFRCFFYLLQTAMEDEESQKNGFVLVSYNVGKKYAVMDRHFVWHAASMCSVLPIRTVCIHYCYDHEPRHISFIKLFIGKKGRKRLRLHKGTDLECQYDLVTFGIPQSTLPITHDGELRIDCHCEWLKQQRHRELHLPPDIVLSHCNNSNRDDNDVIVVAVPNRQDVLLGRGKTISEHAGNLRLHFLVDQYAEEYDKAEKVNKTKISKDIISQIGGRFLKKEITGWVQVDDLVAREKVSHCFRTRRRQQSYLFSVPKRENNEQNESCTSSSSSSSSSGSNNNNNNSATSCSCQQDSVRIVVSSSQGNDSKNDNKSSHLLFFGCVGEGNQDDNASNSNSIFIEQQNRGKRLKILWES